jgi:hypothetical protein
VAKCKYKVKGVGEFDSFAKLLNEFVEKNISSYETLSDIVYSKYQKRDAIREQLVTLSKEYVPKRRKNSVNSAISTIIDGEPAIGDSDVISTSELIDHPACMIDGSPLITQMKTEDYIEAEVSRLIKDGKSEEDAIKIVN